MCLWGHIRAPCCITMDSSYKWHYSNLSSLNLWPQKQRPPELQHMQGHLLVLTTQETKMETFKDTKHACVCLTRYQLWSYTLGQYLNLGKSNKKDKCLSGVMKRVVLKDLFRYGYWTIVQFFKNSCHRTTLAHTRKWVQETTQSLNIYWVSVLCRCF